MAAKRNKDESAQKLFADELRACRAKAGWSREEFGPMINYSTSLVCMVENMERWPTLEFAQRCDEAFDRPGSFERIQVRVRSEPFPGYFRPFAIHEAEATALYNFQVSLVPGLLQTRDYAHALLTCPMGVTPELVEQRLNARLERQAILDRPKPPLLWVVLDEAVLRRPVGGREVMRTQIDHLIEMGRRPNIMIQIVPQTVGEYQGVNGAFVVVDFADAPSIAYLDTALTGFIIERPEHVTEVKLSYETLRADALSPVASLSTMEEVAKIWT
ncbi:MAG TPA: Scr1 family TA system antitoxin-like transcriptional regulator [Streptosporangiaceae bacterium]